MNRKSIKYILFLIVIINILIMPVKASTIKASDSTNIAGFFSSIIKKNNKSIKVESLSSICDDKNVKIIVKALGYTLLISKIIVPIVLMGGTIMNYTKAMTANDEKGIKEATSKFVKAGIAALIVFFLPTIVNLVLSLAEDDKYATNDYVTCRTCFFEVNKCK